MVAPVLLFDVFRTLVDFDGDHVDEHTFDHLARWLWYRGVDVEGDELRMLVGGIKDAELAKSLSPIPDVETTAVWSAALDRLDVPAPKLPAMSLEAALVYRQLTTRSITVWPGTFEMLDACAGFRLAIASNTQRAYTEPELQALGLWDRFEVVVFSSDVRSCKPDPAIFRRALNELGVSPAEVLYVGDNPIDDVSGAAALGIPTILLDRGTPVPDGSRTSDPLASIVDGEPGEVARIARAYFGIAS